MVFWASHLPTSNKMAHLTSRRSTSRVRFKKKLPRFGSIRMVSQTLTWPSAESQRVHREERLSNKILLIGTINGGQLTCTQSRITTKISKTAASATPSWTLARHFSTWARKTTTISSTICSARCQIVMYLTAATGSIAILIATHAANLSHTCQISKFNLKTTITLCHLSLTCLTLAAFTKRSAQSEYHLQTRPVVSTSLATRSCATLSLRLTTIMVRCSWLSIHMLPRESLSSTKWPHGRL